MYWIIFVPIGTILLFLGVLRCLDYCCNREEEILEPLYQHDDYYINIEYDSPQFVIEE